MLARHEQDVAKALLGEMPRLGSDLLDLKGHTLDGILTGKSTVGAGVDAFVREVERGEEPHRAAEVSSRHSCRTGGKGLERGIAHRLQQGFKGSQGGRFAGDGLIEEIGKTHAVLWRRQLH